MIVDFTKVVTVSWSRPALWFIAPIIYHSSVQVQNIFLCFHCLIINATLYISMGTFPSLADSVFLESRFFTGLHYRHVVCEKDTSKA